MKYSIFYTDPKIYGMPRAEDIKEVPKKFSYSEIEDAVSLAETIFKIGCHWVQIVDEHGEIYAEYEY